MGNNPYFGLVGRVGANGGSGGAGTVTISHADMMRYLTLGNSVVVWQGDVTVGESRSCLNKATIKNLNENNL